MMKATNSVRLAVLCGLASIVAPTLVAAQAVAVQPAAQTVSLGATDAVTTFQYTAGANVNFVVATLTLTDTGNDLSGETFEVFNGTAFVACDGNSVSGTGSLAGVTITCNVITPNAAARYLVDTGGGPALPSITSFGRVRYNVGAAPADVAPDPSVGVGAVCATGVAGSTGCTRYDDVNGQVAGGSVTGNTIDVVSGPAAPSVTIPATAAIPAGPLGVAGSTTIPVTVGSPGVAVASLALSCSFPTGSALSVTSGATQTITAPATTATAIGVGCTRGMADVTATLTCTQTATPAATLPNLTSAVTCPAGTVSPNPATIPVAPGPVTLVGPPGGTGVGGVTFTNVGGSQAYTVTSCTPAAGVTVTTTGFPLTVATGGSVPVAATCVTPPAAGTTTTITAGLACATSVAGFNPTFNVACTAQSLSIPTLGFGGKALMVLLMLGFGLVGFQLYRRAA